MNPLPPNADELVSAYLDGQAAPDEVATVESSAELMERVEAHRNIADLLGAPLEPPSEQKEAHISAALDAFDAMFSTDATADSAPESAPRLAAVPPVAAEPQQAEKPAAVTSLSEARERRRPRRFNTGVIAAAVAAVLLFVAVAAFGLSGDDSAEVANSSGESVTDATAASDDTEEEAMGDEASGSALNESRSAAQAPTAAAPEADARVESADVMADEDEPMDDEEAMSDEAEEAPSEAAADFDRADNDAGVDAADDAADDAGAPSFSFADLRFADQQDLLAELESFTIEELNDQALLLDDGLFAGCQAEIDELDQVESPTLVGQTFIDGDPVEVHRMLDEVGNIIFVIVDADCLILPAAP